MPLNMFVFPVARRHAAARGVRAVRRPPGRRDRGRPLRARRAARRPHPALARRSCSVIATRGAGSALLVGAGGVPRRAVRLAGGGDHRHRLRRRRRWQLDTVARRHRRHRRRCCACTAWQAAAVDGRHLRARAARRRGCSAGCDFPGKALLRVAVTRAVRAPDRRRRHRRARRRRAPRRRSPTSSASTSRSPASSSPTPSSTTPSSPGSSAASGPGSTVGPRRRPASLGASPLAGGSRRSRCRCCARRWPRPRCSCSCSRPPRTASSCCSAARRRRRSRPRSPSWPRDLPRPVDGRGARPRAARRRRRAARRSRPGCATAAPSTPGARARGAGRPAAATAGGAGSRSSPPLGAGRRCSSAARSLVLVAPVVPGRRRLRASLVPRSSAERGRARRCSSTPREAVRTSLVYAAVAATHRRRRRRGRPPTVVAARRDRLARGADTVLALPLGDLGGDRRPRLPRRPRRSRRSTCATRRGSCRSPTP